MKLKLRGLKQGDHSYVFDEPAAEYELDPEQFIGSVVSSVTVDYQGKNYYIVVNSQVQVQFQCDRCLEKLTKPVEAETRIIYTEDHSLNTNEEDDGLFFLAPGKDAVELNDEIRQNILLMQPMKVLCRNDCKGLCPQCGKNKNTGLCDCSTEKIDPRWETLLKLKTNDS